MRRAAVEAVVLVLVLGVGSGALFAGSAGGQVPNDVRDEVMRQFEVSIQKFIALAEAMPAGSYEWSPGEGVMEVGRVYMHVARYNYMYPSESMGAALPSGVVLEGMEEERDKERVLAALRESRDWVRSVVGSMSAEELAAETRLYGRDVPHWAVLVQLVSHMNEHLGQSVAYARMNDVVPPWSG